MHKTAINVVVGLGLLAGFAACSDDGGAGDEDANGGVGNSPVIRTGGSGGDGGDNSGRGGTSGNNTGGGGLVSTSGGNTCEIEYAPLEEGCVGQEYEPETIPLDIYIMFDQSGSMISCLDPDTDAQACPDPTGPTRIGAIRTATEEFLRDPASIGIRVGIGYFGYQMGFGTDPTSCDPADYSDAAVPIDLLPDHADAIMESLNAIEPIGETPTAAAIRGACSYAREHKRLNPAHKVVILLVTDGEPKAPRTCPDGTSDDPSVCCPTLADAVDAASECADGLELGSADPVGGGGASGTAGAAGAAGAPSVAPTPVEPPIQTYVLGVGPFLGNLQGIAEAGGTEQAYLVQGGDVAAKVRDALNAIRGEATIPCEMQLPEPREGEELDTTSVNMVFANAVCDAEIFYKVETIEGCTSEGGWYYDDEFDPTKIQLCPASCEEVSIPGGKMLFSVGCKSIEIIR